MRGNLRESNVENITDEERKALNEFLLYINVNIRSETTIKNYKQVIERFLAECRLPLQLLNKTVVLKWLKKLATDEKQCNMRLTISALTSFFRFCSEMGYMKNIVINHRWDVGMIQSIPSYLTSEEQARVRLVSKDFPIRDKALTLLLMCTGCLSSEICNLLIKDIDLKRQIVKIRGDKAIERKAVLSTECKYALEEYLQTRESESTRFLFVNHLDEPLKPKTIYQITQKLGEKARLKQPLTINVIRKTLSMIMFKSMNKYSIPEPTYTVATRFVPIHNGMDVSYSSEWIEEADRLMCEIFSKIKT